MPKQEMTKDEQATETGQSAGKLFTFTIDASTAQIVRLELLLTPLIEHSPARRLMQREALNRAILGTLIQHAMKAPAAADTSSTTGLQSDRAAPARAN